MISIVKRVVMAIRPLPYFSAAAAMAWLSAAVIFPFLVITRTLKLSVPLLCRQPSAFKRVISSALTVTLPDADFLYSLKVKPPSNTFVLV